MRFFRPQRVEKLIREELSKIIARDYYFPGALATITEVQVDKKMDHAKAMISVLPAHAAESVLHALNKDIGQLQHMLLKKINIKPMPRIAFAIDHGLENAARVEKAFIKEEKKD
jgi:ribosome-binding factor A